MSLYDFEHEKHAQGYKYICGVDEAGRGPLAGPVFAAAVILPEDYEIDGVNDSKKLSEKKREKLFDEIIEHALAYSIKSCDNFTIDDINILAATMQTMKNAVDSLTIKPDIVFVDGNRLPELDIPAEYVIHGDAVSASIAAASILAKVSRDRFMYEMDKKYPEYDFAKHKGYPTPEHLKALEKLGPCPEHRRSFGPVSQMTLGL